MVSVVLLPGVMAALLVMAAGVVVGSDGTGFSAGLGIAVVLVNFVASGLSLAWAAERSLSTVPAVALGGFAARLITVVAVMALLDPVPWFSPAAFGLTAIPAFFAILVVESVLVFKGLGSPLLPSNASESVGSEDY